MGLFELFFIGVGLSMDAFAVSICKGLNMEMETAKASMDRPLQMETAKASSLYFSASFRLSCQPSAGFLESNLKAT